MSHDWNSFQIRWRGSPWTEREMRDSQLPGWHAFSVPPEFYHVNKWLMVELISFLVTVYHNFAQPLRDPALKNCNLVWLLFRKYTSNVISPPRRVLLQAGFLSFRSSPLRLQPSYLSLSHFLVCTLCLTHPTSPSVIWQGYNLESFLFSSNSFGVHTSPSPSILLHLLALLPAVCVFRNILWKPLAYQSRSLKKTRITVVILTERIQHRDLLKWVSVTWKAKQSTIENTELTPLLELRGQKGDARVSRS